MNTRALAAPAISRRSFLLGSAAAAGATISLSGCATFFDRGADTGVYGALPDERFPLPAVDVSDVDPRLLRHTVRYTTSEPVGTIVVELQPRYLYHVEEEGMATRYGINAPRDPFEWEGVAFIDRKAEWPIWTPTPAQQSRDPSLRQWAGGMPPGITNPLGSRALYLYQNGVYTLCTIYGTDQAWTLGQGVSSGCIGLLNQDVIHLYNRTPLGTRVVIIA